MRTPSVLFILFLTLQFSSLLFGKVAYKRLSFLTPPTDEILSTSFSSNAVSFQGKLFFSGNDIFNGFEPWVTDGTRKGTYMVKDYFPGGSSFPNSGLVVNDHLYFRMNNISGEFLWVSNGTLSGTYALLQLTSGIPAYSYSTEDQFALADGYYFTQFTPALGMEYCRIQEGSNKVTFIDLNLGPASSAPHFRASNGTHAVISASLPTGEGAWWIFDGTPDGTYFLRKTKANPVSAWVSGPNFILLETSYETKTTSFWRTNGRGLEFLFEFPVWIQSPASVFQDGHFLFLGFQSDSFNALYSTDLTVPGTTFVISLKYPFTLFSQLVGGRALVFGSDTLYSSDGTEEGTLPLLSGIDYLSLFGFINQEAIIGAYTHYQTLPVFRPNEGSLYQTNGRTLTVLLTNYTVLLPLASFRNKVYFNCGDPFSGGLCVTDGTKERTRRIKTIRKVYNGFTFPTPVTGEYVGFRLSYPVHAFIADGTKKGTREIGYQAGDMVAGKGVLGTSLFYVSYSNSSSWRLSTYNFSAHTSSVIFNGSEFISILGASNSQIFFRLSFSELWATTAEQGAEVDLGPMELSYSLVWNEELYYMGSKTLLKKSNGTLSGTVQVKEFERNRALLYLVPIQTTNSLLMLFSIDSETDYEVWETDGSTEGTFLLFVIPWSVDFNTIKEAPELGLFFFARLDPYVSLKLYRFDDQRLVEVRTWGAITEYPVVQGAALSGRFVFTIPQPGGIELWSSDGTFEGTAPIRLRSNPVFSSTTGMLSAAGRIFFSAWTPEDGEQVWYTKGTNETTKVVPNPNLPSGVSTMPQGYVALEDRVYFGGIAPWKKGLYVREVHSLSKYNSLFSSLIPQSLSYSDFF